MNRVVGTLITLVWLACMAALLERDVIPFWRAQDPPGRPIPPGAFQVAIRNQAGRRVGTTWITTSPMPAYTAVLSSTRLDLGSVAPGLPGGTLFFDTDLSYDAAGLLDEFAVRLDTAAIAARVTGVRYDREFACTARIGSLTRTMSFDGELSRYLGDCIRPFTYLRGLHVGQTWRLRLIDPIALLTRGALAFDTQLVRVTGRETISHQGRRVPCYRIETQGATAWANDAGRVLRQEVRIPLLGEWTLVDEPFDRRARKRAREAVRHLREARRAGIPGDTLTGALGAD